MRARIRLAQMLDAIIKQHLSWGGFTLESTCCDSSSDAQVFAEPIDLGLRSSQVLLQKCRKGFLRTTSGEAWPSCIRSWLSSGGAIGRAGGVRRGSGFAHPDPAAAEPPRRQRPKSSGCRRRTKGTSCQRVQPRSCTSQGATMLRRRNMAQPASCRRGCRGGRWR